jgi:3-oxoacyl-[acyl-carrier protein] reductase
MNDRLISLKDKVAVITGASRGIGRAVAIMFAQAGCDVVINYCNDQRSAIRVKHAAEKLGVRAEVVKADMSNEKQVSAMVDATIRRLGKIDILVCNAGIWKEHAIDKISAAALRETIGINLLGTFYAIRAVVPHMKKHKSGVIITISSTAGQRGEPFHSPYAASKGGIISLTKSLAVELAPHNIRVNCVAPGWIDTDMARPALKGKQGAEVMAEIPMGRAGTPEELAGPVLFLASDLSTFITGEILNVNGGAVLCG